MGWNRVAIVGVGMIPFGELFDLSYEAMIEEAYVRALDGVDKGIEPREIETAWLGTCRPLAHGTETLAGVSLAGILGLAGIPCTRVENGCPTGSDAFRNACLGVASGVYDVALVVGAEKMRDKSTEESLLGRATQGHPVFQRGESAPITFAPQATRHMHEFGTTKEQMALVAVKNHGNGARNPYSHHRKPLTVEQVLRSPWVCYPLNLFDCCPQTDGAAAAIVVRADLAPRYTDHPVYVAGFGMATDYQYIVEKESFTTFVATVRAAEQAYRMAGITPADVDVAEVHDCFTITELINYEDLGFCAKGEGGKLIERGETALAGRIPVNPSGGLLAKGHPLGATGVAQIAELFWQLRGEAPGRQVEVRTGYGLQHNLGGTGIANSVVTILTTRRDG
jgi:acetyl-CoA C-acetyltransferase